MGRTGPTGLRDAHEIAETGGIRRATKPENVSLEYEEHCVGELDAPGDDEAAELAGHAQEAAGDDGEDDLDET